MSEKTKEERAKEFGRSFNWTALAEWIAKGQPYEEHDEVFKSEWSC